MTFKRLIYSSRRSPKLDLEDTIDLITEAAERNATVGITGFILFADKFFLQALEGEASAVDETFARIERDPRHSDLDVLDQSEGVECCFAQWSMGFASGGEERDALLAEAGIDADTEVPHIDADRALELLKKLSAA